MNRFHEPGTMNQKAYHRSWAGGRRTRGTAGRRARTGPSPGTSSPEIHCFRGSLAPIPDPSLYLSGGGSVGGCGVGGSSVGGGCGLL